MRCFFAFSADILEKRKEVCYNTVSYEENEESVMDLKALCQKRRLVFDGGTGTLLVARGLRPGELPESWNYLHPDVIEELHRQYIEAGADIIKTNTFGAYSFKLSDKQKEAVTGALDAAERARRASGREVMIALDVGPLGRLLEPFGDLPFEEAVSYFKELISLGHERADLILIETMSDLYELKAAIVAAKEISSLPIVATVALDERGRILTGADVETVVTVLEGLGVSALGVNCGFGPAVLKPFVEKILSYSSLPVVCNPNAGLPRIENGKAVYQITPEQYRCEIKEILSLDVAIVGGCCGTTPAHIAAIASAVKAEGASILKKERLSISGYTRTVTLSDSVTVIGDSLNAKRNPASREAYSDGDADALLDEAFDASAYGVQLLDVSCAEDGALSLSDAVSALQESIPTPFLLTSQEPTALADAVRRYNGKPLICLDGAKSPDFVFSLMRRYGGVMLRHLASDSPEAAMQEATALLDRAKESGFDKKDLLLMPRASDPATALAVSTALCQNGFYTVIFMEAASGEDGTFSAVYGDLTDDTLQDYLL